MGYKYPLLLGLILGAIVTTGMLRIDSQPVYAWTIILSGMLTVVWPFEPDKEEL